nr:hypothetical protein [Tanacetum cinerariifolium]
EIVKLNDRVKVLEDREGVAATQSGDDDLMKGGVSMKGRQLLKESVMTQRRLELEEQLEKEDMRMNEQISRDAEVARIHAKEELQGMIDSLDQSNETIAKYLQEYQDFTSELPLEKRIELISDLGKGSGTPTKPHHTPSPEVTSSHPSTSSIPLPFIPPVTQTGTTPIIQYTRRARIAQSFAFPTLADEPASPVRDDSQGEACPTDSGCIADQDRETIAKSSTLPRDSAPRVTSPAAEEGSMQQTINKLTDFCTSLQRQHLELLAKFQAQEVEINKLKERVKILEDKEGVIREKSVVDAPIKGRSFYEGEPPTERISNDSEEIARVLTFMDATTVLAGEANVPTGSGFIPTAGPPATIVSTGSKKKKLQEQINAQVARELEEQQEREDIRMNEQIARDAEVARIHAEEEIQAMIDSLDKSNETVAKHLQEYQQFASDLSLEKKIELISDLVKYQEHYTKVYKFQSQQRKSMSKKQKREYYMAVIKSYLGWRFKDFKGMLFKEIEDKFAQVWKRIEDFTPMGSKEEAKRAKRQGIILDKEQVKKQKSSEEAPESKTPTEEVSEDKIKEMMQLVPIEDVYV